MSNASSNQISRPAGTPQSKVARVPWHPALGVIFVVFIYFASQIAGGFLVSIYPRLQHWSHKQAIDWLTNSVTAQFIFIVLAEAFTIGAIYLFLRGYKRTFNTIGLKRPRWKDFGYGLLAIPAYFIIYGVVLDIVSHYVPSLNVNQTQQIGFDHVQGTLQLIMTFISLAILPPLAEEITVRGFLYSSLKKGMHIVPAALLTSALFAAAHLPEGGSAGPLYIAALDTFVLSLVLIYLREKTGSLWASITLHAAKNSVAFLVLFVLHTR